MEYGTSQVHPHAHVHPRLAPLCCSRRRVHLAADQRGKSEGGVDVALLTYFALWYLGNYYYNITNKLALKAAGGAAGFPMILSTLQLGVGEETERAAPATLLDRGGARPGGGHRPATSL